MLLAREPASFLREIVRYSFAGDSQVKTGMTNVAGHFIPSSTGGHVAGASAAYERTRLDCHLKALSIMILLPGVGGGRVLRNSSDGDDRSNGGN